jgi:DNA polymerase III subunit epsilon
MRQVVLDTETTGLSVDKGHRVVEIGCVELVERRLTGRRFQRYLNPQRSMDVGAREVTGLTDEFLADKALFADVADELIDFIRDSELIIHNAAFDVGFLDAEFARLGRGVPPVQTLARVTDSLLLARERFPGQRNSLDALCKRFEVNNAHRTTHGALLDAQLLAEVYLALTAGQGDLGFALGPPSAPRDVTLEALQPALARLRVRRADPAEQVLHEARLAALPAAARAMWDAAAVHCVPAAPANRPAAVAANSELA